MTKMADTFQLEIVTSEKMVVKESAEELSSVNAGIKDKIANQDSPSGLEDALRKVKPLKTRCRMPPTSYQSLTLRLRTR